MNKFLVERNETGAKEAADEILKGGLSRAMHERVDAEAKGHKKHSKAVDFFLRRRERCDKYVRESVAPAKKTEEEILMEKEAELKKKFEEKQKREGRLQVEQVEVPSLVNGEIKLPPMKVNVENNGRIAQPFGSSITWIFYGVIFDRMFHHKIIFSENYSYP